jgi:Raf kinase inhibitor-like YbhB/YbcL family protein
MDAGRIGCALVVVATMALAGCGSGDDGIDVSSSTPGFVLGSTAFSAGEAIPEKYAGATGGGSPPLAWTGAPEGTKSLALIVDDPDAGGFTHWVVYDIPASASALPEGCPKGGTLPEPRGARQGTNSMAEPGWYGPKPPEKHRYVFTLYALDAELGLDEGARKADVLGAMEGHVLGQTVLWGTFTP